MVSIPADTSRKRLRSASGSSSASGESSPKRALSDSPGPNSLTHPINPVQAPSSSGPDSMQPEIDEYMKSQEEELSLDTIALSPPATTSAAPPPLPNAAPKPQLSPKEKLEKIQSLKSRPLVACESWFVISRDWYANWESACGGAKTKGAPPDESFVPSIDNSSIVGSPPDRLDETKLAEGDDIELVPAEAWDLLVSWYGVPNYTFPRRVVTRGAAHTKIIELVPPAIHISILSDTPSPPTLVTLTLAMMNAYRALQVAIYKTAKIDRKTPHRIWVIRQSSRPQYEPGHAYTPAQLVTSGATLRWTDKSRTNENDMLEVPAEDGDTFIVEHPDSQGQWYLEVDTDDKAKMPIGPQTASTSTEIALRDQGAPSPPDSQLGPLFGETSDFFTEKYGASTSKPATIVPGASRDPAKAVASTGGWPTSGGYGNSMAMTRAAQPAKPRGTVGLINLGNTCFMNSALQCLAHLPELTEYFLGGVCERELNPDNPLSTGGELAKSYAKLLNALFPNSTGYIPPVAPREFKTKLAHFAPSFSGYQQHDTQELLAFLLDGLHEDLNRVLKKPYVENPDWEGGGLREVIKLARDYWDGYKKRNDSVIVDFFQGQYKSTLVCPVCDKVSITFDPFMYLTLPIPVVKRWKHELFFVTYEVDRPNYKTNIELPHTATFRDVKVLLAKWFNSDPDYILSTEIFQFRFYKFIPDHTMVSDFSEADSLFFYELPIKSGQAPTAQPAPTDPIVCPVYTISPSRSYSNYYRNNTYKQRDMWGYPFFIAFKPGEDESPEFIYKALVERYTQATWLADDLYVLAEQKPPAPAAEEVTGEANGTVLPPGLETDQKEAAHQDTKPDEEDEEMDVIVAAPIRGTSHMSVDSPAPEEITAASESAPPRLVVRCEPKDELFSWSVRQGNFRPNGPDQGSYDSGLSAPLWERSKEAEANAKANDDDMADALDPELKAKLIKRSTGLLRREDAIVCEWDTNFQQFYFGERGMGKESRWNTTELYVDPEQAAAQAAQKSKQKKGLTVEDCLDEFVKEEKLGQDDLWYCPRCKEHRQATKKLEIWKVPDVLVVHLKRFSNSRMLRDKIEELVDFPVNGFDLSERVGERAAMKALIEAGEAEETMQIGNAELDEPLLYDLFAVDEHMGGLGGGHYRAYAKNETDDQWYHFDDAHVTKATAERSVTPLAYLLFYRRRTDNPIGGPTVEKTVAAKLAGPLVPAETQVDPTKVASSSKTQLSTAAPIMTSISPLLEAQQGSLESIPSLGSANDDILPRYPSVAPHGSPTSSNGAAGIGSPMSDSPWSQDEWTNVDNTWERGSFHEVDTVFGSAGDLADNYEDVEDVPVEEIRPEMTDSISDLLVPTQPAPERFEID